MKLDRPNFGRKTPPPFAGLQIADLAAQGFSKRGIAARFQISADTFNKWLEIDETLNEAFKMGREEERYALHNALYKKAMAGDGPAAMFLLKARFGYREGDQSEQANKVAITFNLPGALDANSYSKAVTIDGTATAKRLPDSTTFSAGRL